MKYVICEDGGIQFAILFDELMKHDQFAHRKPISAGFVDLSGDSVPHVHGKSVSLQLVARPQDVDVIVETLNRKMWI